MTLPNKLTVVRILLTFLIMALLFTPGWMAKAAALGVFLLASLTDWLDGYLARRWQETTPFGALLDPIADKVLVLGTFLAFVQLRLIPAWMVLIIVLREFVITGVRLFAASRQVILSAAREGKHKTVSQMVTLIVIFVVVIIKEFAGKGALPMRVQAVMGWTMLACLWITTCLTVISGAAFFWRYRDVLREAASKHSV